MLHASATLPRHARDGSTRGWDRRWLRQPPGEDAIDDSGELVLIEQALGLQGPGLDLAQHGRDLLGRRRDAEAIEPHRDRVEAGALAEHDPRRWLADELGPIGERLGQELRSDVLHPTGHDSS